MIKRSGNKFIFDDWDETGLSIPKGQYYSSSDIKVSGCPGCEEEGKKKEPSVSIIPSDGYGKCHKCGLVFIKNKEEETKEYRVPSKKNLTQLSDRGLKALTDRKISQEAAIKLRIIEGKVMDRDTNTFVDAIAFQYIYNGKLVNVKYRGMDKKIFGQSGGGMHMLYNHDNALEYMESSGDFRLVITEGEFDVAAFETAGIPFAVSVDSGAINEKDVRIDGKVECIDNCQHLIDLADIIYLAFDNDDQGRRLTEEVSRRIDTEKIRLVDFGQHKDANESLMYDEDLHKLLEKAKEIKMEGVYSAEDAYDKLDDIYKNGLPKGTTTYLPSIDRIWTWRIGETNLWTGYKNEGKSTFLLYICMLKAVFEGWKFAFYTPENFPIEEFYEDLIHMYIGKTADKDYSGRMTKEEFNKGKAFANKHFFLVRPEKNPNLDNILDRTKYLVKRYGIRGLIIDPYNTIENNFTGREDLYISALAAQLKVFTVLHGLSTHLVAHQNKPKVEKGEIDYPAPDDYNVKGGGTFPDKFDNTISVWRPFRRSKETSPVVEIESQKIKKKKLTGMPGKVELYYSWQKNQYQDKELQGKSPMETMSLAMPEESLELEF